MHTQQPNSDPAVKPHIPESDVQARKDYLIQRLYEDRLLAHKHLFPKNRKNDTPAFHEMMLRAFYSDHKRVIIKCFRGAAKSTLTEEAAVIGTLFRDFRFLLIIGNDYRAACERLATIKHEFESNEAIIELFGSQVGPTWRENEIVLANGARIKAYGSGQSLRGAKHLADRPDCTLIDDLEDHEAVATELARHKVARWLHGDLIPAMVPWGKIRMSGTPLHPKSLVEEKVRSADWYAIQVPICYLDPDTGEEKSSWPDRFSMDYINNKRAEYQAAGAMTEFEQEFMIRSEDVASKPFQAEHIRTGSAPAGYVPRIVIVDPARTTGPKSARTGYAVFTPRVGGKSYVFDGYGRFHKPDEIIKEIIALDEKYKPTFIGVEKDGLEEFIMQPLREAQLALGITLPIVPLKAPKDKIGFITGMQPFYIAGEVIHVGPIPDLEAELVQFPTGRVDVVNALAYMNRIVAGDPVYPDFNPTTVSEDILLNKRQTRYLCVTCCGAMTAAVLAQVIDGCLRVFKDWVFNEPAEQGLRRILPEAKLLAGDFTVCVPSEQYDKYMNHGLPAALKAQRIDPVLTSTAVSSVEVLSKYMTTQYRGAPCFMISPQAEWTLRGLMLGYRRSITKSGTLETLPDENHYSLVVSAIESFAKYLSSGTVDKSDDRRYSYTKNGERYVSLLPGDR